MKQWEYRVITYPPNLSGLALQGDLTKMGADGWELAAILGIMFILKRELRMVQ